MNCISLVDDARKPEMSFLAPQCHSQPQKRGLKTRIGEAVAAIKIAQNSTQREPKKGQNAGEIDELHFDSTCGIGPKRITPDRSTPF